MTTSILSNIVSESLLQLSIPQKSKFMFTPPPPTININSDKIVKSIKFIKTLVNDIAYIIINPDKHKSGKYLIFAHDNNSDIVAMYDFAKNWANKLAINVVLFDYPGYGLSKGNPSEDSCYDSITLVVNDFVAKVNSRNITLVGHELGTGVVIEYVYRNKWTCPIILISAYKNIMCESYDIFRTLPKLNNIECPIKLFHSDLDNVVDISHSKEIYKHMRNKKLDPIWLSGVSHNKTLDNIDLNIIKRIIGN